VLRVAGTGLTWHSFNAPDHGAVVPQAGLPDKFFWQHNGSYRLNTTRRHPPSVIAQPQGDDFVPPTVAENYVRALKEANISGNRCLVLVSSAI
jgi:hypothetical protein